MVITVYRFKSNDRMRRRYHLRCFAACCKITKQALVHSDLNTLLHSSSLFQLGVLIVYESERCDHGEMLNLMVQSQGLSKILIRQGQ